jgi:opacity protein-like surface antigen
MIAGMRTQTAMLLLSVAGFALPAAAQTTPWYLGGSLGVSRTSDDLVANRESTIVNGLLDAHTDFDARDTAFKLTGGYRFLPWLAVEVDYTDLGKHSLVSDLFGGNPPAAAQIFLERRIRGYGADAVFTMPVLADWRIMGRVGAFHADLKAKQALAGNIVFTNGDPSERERSTSISETVLRWGAGVEWDITHCSWLRLEWTRHEDIGKAFAVGGSGTTGEAATDSVLLGYYYRF